MTLRNSTLSVLAAARATIRHLTAPAAPTRFAALATLVTTLALSSCMITDDPPPIPPGDGEEVTILFNPVAEGVPDVPKTRAGGYHDNDSPELGDPVNDTDPDSAYGRLEDVSINALRVMLYKSNTGELMNPLETQPIAVGPDRPLTVKVWTGKYDVVFITNETSDNQRLNTFFADTDNYDILKKLENALIDMSAYGADKNIPMYGIVRNVSIKGNNKLQVGNEAEQIVTDQAPWTPTLTRTGVRLSFSITLHPSQWDDWKGSKQITISGIPDAVWLMPKMDNVSPRGSQPRTMTLNASTTEGAAPGWIRFFNKNGTDDTSDDVSVLESQPYDEVRVTYDRIIVPELVFNDNTIPDDKALVLSMNVGRTMSGYINGPEPTVPGFNRPGYTLQRNTWLHMDVTVAATKLEVTPKVREWNTTGIEPPVVGEIEIRSESPLYVAGSGRPQISPVSTNYEGGIDLQYTDDTETQFTVEYEGTPTGWITSVTIDGDDGDMQRNITVTASPNPGANRSARIYVMAGGVRKDIKVIQSYTGVPASPGMIGYIVTGPDRGQLTLRGSVDYTGTPVEEAALDMFPEEGGLHPETVYATYFKWGSLIVMRGGPNSDGFDPGDVVIVPDEYNASSITNWASVSYSSSVGSGWPASRTRPYSDGLGDPCQYYFGDSWRVPTGTGGVWNEGNFGTSSINSTPNWAVTTPGYGYGARWLNAIQQYPPLPYNGAVGGDGAGNYDWTMFLPAAGYRANNGVGYQNSTGAYWSSAMESNNRHALRFTDASLMTNGGDPAEFAMAIRCVTDEIPVRRDVIMAAPGVLGIKKSDYDALQRGEKALGDGTYRLTIKGSSTYKDAAAVKNIADTQFGGLEREPVYTVYFKWGSQIAMLAPKGATTWNPADVVWVPKGLDLQQVDLSNYATGFHSAPPASVGTGNDIPAPNASLGYGDPCVTIPGQWQTPHGGASSGTAYTEWNSMPDGDWRSPTNAIDVGASDATGNVYSIFSNDNTMFLPLAGTRHYQTGNVMSNEGVYWSSTSGGTDPYVIAFNSSNLTGTQGLSIHVKSALPVRCVPIPPPRLATGVHAPPGVIGYISTGDRIGELTLRGSSAYAGTAADVVANRAAYGGAPEEVPVYVAYFKFGSLVALSSEKTDLSTSTNYFDADDVIIAPTQYGGVERVEEDIGTATNTAAWAHIPFSGPLAPGGKIVYSPADGWGDPCEYYFPETRWNMPSGAASGTGWAHGALGTTNNNTLPLSNGVAWSNSGLPERGLIGPGGSGSTAVGQYWYTSMFMPAAGHRTSTGYINSQGSIGYYWSDTAQSTTNGYSLMFSSSNTNAVSVPNPSYEYGFAVRCVQPTESPAGEWSIGSIIWAGSNLVDNGEFGETPEEDGWVFWWATSSPNEAGTTIGSNQDGPSGDTPWTNSPCPWGWRLPTRADMLETIGLSTMISNENPRGVFVTGSTRFPVDDGSRLFLPSLGYNQGQNGHSVDNNNGHYWTSTLSGSNAYKLLLTPGTNGTAAGATVPIHTNSGSKRADALAVRCVRDK